MKKDVKKDAGFTHLSAVFLLFFLIMPSFMEVKAAIAAIPKRDGDIQDIEYYRFVYRRFLR